MKNSPWGSVQHSESYGRGLHFVSTAGHGGFLISKKLAETKLSSAARKIGFEWGNYLAFEEDCAALVVNYEILETLTDGQRKKGLGVIVKSLSRWYPNYSIEIGVNPHEAEYKIWKQNRERDLRRTQKDPNLIVSACSVGLPSGSCEVWTADNEKHFVTLDSYRKVQEAGTYNLSDCVKL